MKKYALTVGVLVAVLAVGGMAHADDEGLKFQATLSGAQEVLEVDTETTGRIRVEFNKALSEAEFRLVVRDGKQVGSALHVMLALRCSSRQIVVTDKELDGPDMVGELFGKRQRLTYQA